MDNDEKIKKLQSKLDKLEKSLAEMERTETNAPAQRLLAETHGLLVATGMFWEQVGKLIFPSQPLFASANGEYINGCQARFCKNFRAGGHRNDTPDRRGARGVLS